MYILKTFLAARESYNRHNTLKLWCYTLKETFLHILINACAFNASKDAFLQLGKVKIYITP